jgi:capsular exopolysaccharide synthesis family protein
MNSRDSVPFLLAQYASRLKRHWLPAVLVFTFFSALGIVGALLQPVVYEAEGKLVLKRATPTSTLTEVGKEVDRLDALTNLGNPALTESEIVQSTPVLQNTLNQLGWRDPRGEAISVFDFKRSLTVSAVNATDIIKIAFKERDAAKAAAAVNKVMEEYIDYAVRSNRNDISRARQFIEQQLPKAEVDVKRAETALREFKVTNQLANLDARVSATEARITALQEQITDNQAQMASLEAQMAATSQKIGMAPEQALAIASLSQSPEIQDTLKEIQTTETRLVQERDRLTEDHPAVTSLRNNLANLKALLRQKALQILDPNVSGATVPDSSALLGALKQDLSAELVRLDSTRKGVVKQTADLSRTLATVQQQATRLPRLAQQQNDLERQVQAAQTSYNALLQKLKETQIVANQTQGNARVVAWAVPPEQPSQISKILFLLTGFLLGAMGGVVTAYLLEVAQQRVRTVDEAVELFDLNILGIIPRSERSRNMLFYDGGQAYHIPEVAVRDKPGSPTCEAYRLLQANLKSLSSHRKCRVLIIASSIPQEGTSTVCANLAAAMAQSGRRVLLMDTNLHNPVQDEIWYIPHTEGLSNILCEEVAFWAAVHNVDTNLDVLPAGNAAESPATLLDSPQMELVIDHCAGLYDVVILDAPALTVSADTTLLSHWADGGILVVRPDHLDLENAAAAQGILAQWGDKLIGMVINGVPLGQNLYSYEDPSTKDLKETTDLPSFTPKPLKASLPRMVELLSTDTPNPGSAPSLHRLERLDFEQMSVIELRSVVDSLSHDWLTFTRLVQEQEAELDLQSQTVSELQERLAAAGAYHRQAANEYDRLGLEVQVADGEERKRLLDQTLAGQRRRLREQHEMLRKALDCLREKEKLTLLNTEDTTALEGHPEESPQS